MIRTLIAAAAALALAPLAAACGGDDGSATAEAVCAAATVAAAEAIELEGLLKPTPDVRNAARDGSPAADLLLWLDRYGYRSALAPLARDVARLACADSPPLRVRSGDVNVCDAAESAVFAADLLARFAPDSPPRGRFMGIWLSPGSHPRATSAAQHARNVARLACDADA